MSVKRLRDDPKGQICVCGMMPKLLVGGYEFLSLFGLRLKYKEGVPDIDENLCRSVSSKIRFRFPQSLRYSHRRLDCSSDCLSFLHWALIQPIEIHSLNSSSWILIVYSSVAELPEQYIGLLDQVIVAIHQMQRPERNWIELRWECLPVCPALDWEFWASIDWRHLIRI